jgi:hypothetical protein
MSSLTPEEQSSWRDALTPDEARIVEWAELWNRIDRETIAGRQRQYRAIYLRAKKRLERAHKTVDTSIEHA